MTFHLPVSNGSLILYHSTCYIVLQAKEIFFFFLNFKHTIVISYTEKAARFEILKAALLTIQVFWDIIVCPWVSSSQHSDGTTNV